LTDIVRVVAQSAPGARCVRPPTRRPQFARAQDRENSGTPRASPWPRSPGLDDVEPPSTFTSKDLKGRDVMGQKKVH
jgi:hypothetical protein